jgi:hypothetical protein
MTAKVGDMNNTNTNNSEMVGINGDIHNSHLWHILGDNDGPTCVMCACTDDSEARGLPCEGDPDLAC